MQVAANVAAQAAQADLAAQAAQAQEQTAQAAQAQEKRSWWRGRNWLSRRSGRRR